MPFTKDGLKPDIIINPHTIPSRMTIALQRNGDGQGTPRTGLFGGTSFGEVDLMTICKELQKMKYESKGNEIHMMVRGTNETSIFIGLYYQRLKHMVADKQHSRCIGPMVILTACGGRVVMVVFGLEMERNCMISHGASKFTKERVYEFLINIVYMFVSHGNVCKI